MVGSLTYGGAERVAVCWANGLSKLGHKVEILTDLAYPITYRPNDEIKLIHFKKYQPHSTKGIHRLTNKVRNLMSNVNQFAEIVRISKPDVIINVLYMYVHHLLLAKYMHFRKLPIIMTDHNAYERPVGAKMPFSQWCNKFIDNRFFDCVTVLTEIDRQILLRKGIKNVRVLHNPLFLEPVVNIAGKEKIVLAVGRFDAWYYKGFDILMQSWKIVHEKHPEWTLVVKGNKVDRVVDMLKEAAGQSAVSIEFVQYDDNVLDEYRRASIFVLSSRYEGWGLVAIEAMSQGCATIACDYKGRQAEYITDGENGLLCDPENPVMLSEKICRLIEDENLMKRLQQKAPLSVDEFSEERVAGNLDSIIREIL